MSVHRKTNWLVGVCTAVVLVLGSLSSAWALDPGQKAPDFRLQTHDGKTFQLSKLEGKSASVLVFFATWCPACMAEVPEVKKFVRKTQENGDEILVYGVNARQSDQIVQRFVRNAEVNYRVLLDKTGRVLYDYDVRGIPTVVAIDKGGIIRYVGHQVPEYTDEFIASLTQTPEAHGEPTKVSSEVGAASGESAETPALESKPAITGCAVSGMETGQKEAKCCAGTPSPEKCANCPMKMKGEGKEGKCCAGTPSPEKYANCPMKMKGEEKEAGCCAGVPAVEKCDHCKMKMKAMKSEDAHHGYEVVTRETLKSWLDAGEDLVIVDVLSPSSYHKRHVKGAINIPLAQLKSLKHKLPMDKKIVTYCANFKCQASVRAAEQLVKWGYKHVFEYAGGIADWHEAGFPVGEGKHTVPFLTKEELASLMMTNKDAVVINVLSPESYAKAHIPGSINVPYEQVAEAAKGWSKDTKIVTYCANYVCQASSHAAETLLELGFTDVSDYKGGIQEWQQAGLPVSSTK